MKTDTEELSPEQNSNRGNFIYTCTQNHFYIDDPQPADINLMDLAHALAMQCRFNGQCHYFYSVAQHSVLVSNLAIENPLWGLLHDASEAYLPDVPRPFKSHLENFKELENRILRVIIEKYDLEWPMPEEVHAIDGHIVADEAIQLWSGAYPSWTQYFEPLGIEIQPWSPEVARTRFISRFEELTGEDCGNDLLNCKMVL